MSNIITSLVFALIGSQAFADESLWLTTDFKVVKTNEFSLHEFALDKASCLQQISRAVCLVDPPIASAPEESRVCLHGGSKYVHLFKELYDAYPAHLQKMLCHLRRIYIEKEFIGSAYAGLFTEQGHDEHVLGGLIGIRKSLLDHKSSLAAWASWKEQIHFGTDPTKVTVADGLPRVRTSMHGGQLDMLYFLVTHELGHVFDFTNNLNSFGGCEDHSNGCVMTPKPGSWAAFSWKSFDSPLDTENFPLRSELCYYFCDGKFISADRQDELYQSLVRTNFLSAYTTRYPTEDFADTFAYYTIKTERHASYVNVTVSGESYYPIRRLKYDSLMQPKKQFIQNFLRSPYHYPGDN